MHFIRVKSYNILLEIPGYIEYLIYNEEGYRELIV